MAVHLSRIPFRRQVFAALLLAALVAVILLISPQAPKAKSAVASVNPLSAPVPSITPPARSPPAALPRLATPPDHSPLADELNAPGNTPQRDLEVLKEILGQFTTSLKPQYAPPLGDNQDITAALTGHNKFHITFIPPHHPAVDSQGRLLDRWGTPYFFHARTADTFDLRSAGPDKILFTADDVVRPWK